MRAPALSVLASLTLFLGACGGVRPPSPPSPPPVTQPPAPAAATFPALALHVQAGAFLQPDGTPLDFRGAKACCTSENGEPDPKWPLVSDAWMDYVKARGNVNFVGVRLGPWRAVAGAEDGQADLGGAYLEVGGKADLSQWNPAFWARIDAIQVHAGNLGQRVEVSLIDGWAMKQHCVHGSPTYQPWIPQNNVQGIDACQAQTPGDATQEAYIRKAVSIFGKYHNAVLEISNEGILVPTSAAWEQWVISVVRSEESAHGYPRHLIGSDAMTAGADFGIVHQNAEPSSSQCGGLPCVNNEYNPTPAFTASQLYGFYCAAKARGTYYWYWRHEQGKAAMDDTLARIKGGCAPGPVGCSIPTDSVPQVTPRPNCPAPPGVLTCAQARDALIDEAETHVRVTQPQLFDAAGNLAGWPSNGAQQSAAAQPYFDALVDYLRSKGYCASSWEDSIAWGKQADGWFEEFHVLAFGHGTPIDGAHAYRFTWQWPGGAPTPPPVASCPIPAPGTNWLYELKPEGGQQVDGTPYVGNPTHTVDQPWPGCGTARCPLAIEKGPVAAACQRSLFENPLWGTSGGVCRIVDPTSGRSIVPLEGSGPQPFTIKVADGSCALFLKGTAPGAPQLGGWAVHAGVPPCVVGSNGACQ